MNNGYNQHNQHGTHTAAGANAVFINPYNFIPFGEKPDRTDPANQAGSGKYTGWLDVRVEAKTPLIIPGGELENNNGHITKDFFRLPDGTPAIPGSSLRGMIRSVYETASNSCVPFVLDPDEVITSRTPVYAAFKERGLLEFDKESGCWILYSTIDYEVDDDIDSELVEGALGGGIYHTIEGKDYHNAQKVHFKMETGDPHWIHLSDNDKDPVGILHFQVPVGISTRPTRNGVIPAYHVRVLQKKKKLYTWEPKAGSDGRMRPDNLPYRDLAAELTFTLNSSDKANQAHRDLLEALDNTKKSGGIVPVWYLEIRNGQNQSEYYLSPSAIGRIHQRRGWREIMGEYAPCSKTNCLCPACQLFGNVTDQNSGGMKIKGKVRFSDALYAGGRGKFSPETAHLRILSNPQPSAYEFYLKRPIAQANYWNFDYYAERTNNGANYYGLDRAEPRGRKMYWHSRQTRTLNNPSSNQFGNSKLNGSFKAAPVGSAFDFRIYYDGVTEEQLNGLKWAVTLGLSACDDKRMHKLGHARPLGFGSVKLKIVAEAKREVCWDEAAGSLAYTAPAAKTVPADEQPVCPWNQESESFRALLAMTDYMATGDNIVSYPLSRKGTIFDWFSDNRRASSLKVLSKPTDRDLTLSTDALPTQFDVDPEVPPNQRLAGQADDADENRPGEGGASPAAVQPHAQQDQGASGSGVQATRLTGDQDAVVTRIRDKGAVDLKLTATGEKGFLASWKKGVSALKKDQKVRVRIVRYDPEYKNYQVDLIL